MGSTPVDVQDHEDGASESRGCVKLRLCGVSRCLFLAFQLLSSRPGRRVRRKDVLGRQTDSQKARLMSLPLRKEAPRAKPETCGGPKLELE